MTFDREFVAVRHESDLLTPLIRTPVASLSVRELGYVGAFVMCAMLSFAGAAPPGLAAAGLLLAAAAFFRWRGELPEMYLYYAALAAASAAGPFSGSLGRHRGRRRTACRAGIAGALLGRSAAADSVVVGPGIEYVPPAPASAAAAAAAPAEPAGAEQAAVVAGAAGRGAAPPAAADAAAPSSTPRPAAVVERVPLAGTGAPADLELDIGAARAHAPVTVCVDGIELVQDAANGDGIVAVTMIPRAGTRRFSVLDAAGGEIASRTVEFVGPAARPGGPARRE